MPSLSKQTPRHRRRPRVLPSNRLIGMALQEWDSDSSWKAINQLRERSTPKWSSAASDCSIAQLAQARAGRQRDVPAECAQGNETTYEEYAVLQTHAMLRKHYVIRRRRS